MNKHDFIELLNKPVNINPIQAREIKEIINEFPFFQSARVIYLKALKDSGSFRYNNELKKTASYTTDRKILFNFISSEKFIKQNQPKKVEKTEKKPTKKEFNPFNLEESLKEPLIFQKDEVFSFNTWLELSKNHLPITRKKTEQDDIIDNFIKSSPKISKIDKTKPLEVKVNTSPEYPKLMTETLAKIYLKQKKYDSAIKAYEILSLKYPEKSSFFADQIKQIKYLQK